MKNAYWRVTVPACLMAGAVSAALWLSLEPEETFRSEVPRAGLNRIGEGPVPTPPLAGPVLLPNPLWVSDAALVERTESGSGPQPSEDLRALLADLREISSIHDVLRWLDRLDQQDVVHMSPGHMDKFLGPWVETKWNWTLASHVDFEFTERQLTLLDRRVRRGLRLGTATPNDLPGYWYLTQRRTWTKIEAFMEDAFASERNLYPYLRSLLGVRPYHLTETTAEDGRWIDRDWLAGAAKRVRFLESQDHQVFLDALIARARSVGNR